MRISGHSNLISIIAVYRRFPWVMAASLLGTWAGMAYVHSDSGRPALGLSQVQAGALRSVAYLGIGFFFSLTLIGERLRGAWDRHLLQAAGALLLLNLFLRMEASGLATALRFGMYFAAVHLLVSFAPFLRDRRVRAFWQYNHALFQRIITTLIFSFSIYLGLRLALWALRKLLGWDIPMEINGDLWCLIAGVFNTWFFLAGVPEDIDALERQDNYPLTLKILSQFIFIPLVSLYVIILYAYALKTLARAGLGGEWPETWIAIPFLAAGLWGILSLLLLHPVREEEEKPWVRAFTRWFYPAQGPLLIFLVGVLGHDAFTNGLKVETYLFLVLAFWMMGMAAYFTLGKEKNIKAIPLSLFLLCVICSFGPWGAIGLPRIDRVRQLEKHMAAGGLLREGRFVPATPGHSPPPDWTEIRRNLQYLEKTGGLEILGDRLPPGTAPDYTLKNSERLIKYLGLDESRGGYNLPTPKPEGCRHTYSFKRPRDKTIVDIRGYSSFWKNLELSRCYFPESLVMPGYFQGLRKTDRIVFRCADNTAVITLAGRPFSFSLEKVLIGLEGSLPGIDSCDAGFTSHFFPDEGTLTLVGKNGPMKVALEVVKISWEKDSSHRLMSGMEVDLLFGSK